MSPLDANTVAEIHTLAAAGQSLNEIAGTVGVEVGDLQTVLAGAGFFAEESLGGDAGVGNVFVHRYLFDTSAAHPEGSPSFTPRVGDVLVDAWIDVDAAWDGTTPKADIGQAPFWADQAEGLFAHFGIGAIDLSVAPVDLGGVESEAVADNALSGSASRSVPLRFTTDDPVLLVVSQTGLLHGAAAASTAGSASLYLKLSSPLDPRMR